MKSFAPMDHTHEKGESSPSGVMHDGWCGKLIQHTASLKLAAPSGDYIPDPLAILSIGERDQKSVGLDKNIHWRPTGLPAAQDT